MTTLYTVPTANGQRATIALEECGTAYEVRKIDLVSGEHRNEEMLKLNPFGRMPVLAPDQGAPIYGSMAIAHHAARQSGMLLPPEPHRDAYDHWMGVIMTDLAPAFSAQFYFNVLAPEKYDWGINLFDDIISRFLAAIDDHLGNSEFFLPDDYSMVDVLFYPTAATSIARMPAGLEPYENISRWAETVAKRDAVTRGMAVSS